MSKLLKKFTAPCRFLLPLGLFLFTFHFSLFTVTAQTATATLSGTVVDANGAVVPGATVTLTDTGKGFERKVMTGDDGSFVLPLLQPSDYTLLVARDGFASSQVNNISLTVGDQRAIAVELKVSPVKDEVIVTPDASMVTVGASVGTTISETFVRELPLNGRSFSSLVLLTPGVTITSVSGSSLGQFSVNGQRSSTNYFMVDGVSANFGATSATQVNSLAFAGGLPSQSTQGGTNNLVSQDALQEFKVETSTYSAESGRQPGAQVQVITKSGGNQFHGSAFEFFRNEKLDARNYFNMKPAAQSPLRQNFYGGTFSGPVFLPNIGDGGPKLYDGKNRTFFFFSYEAQRLRLPVAGLVNVPSMRLRSVAAAQLRPILNAFPEPTGAEIRVNCTVNQNDPLCTPNPGSQTQGTKPSGIAQQNYAVSNPSSLDATSVRIDHSIAKGHILFGRFNESPSSSSTYSGGAFSTTNEAATRTLTLGLTSALNSKLSNEFRFNISRQGAEQFLESTTVGGAVPVDPAVLTSGLGGLGSFVFTPVSGNSASIRGGEQVNNLQRQLNIVNNVTWVRGEHQFKFGVDIRRLSPTFGPQDQQNVSFTSEAGIVAGTAGSVNIFRFSSARPRFTNLSFFGQDTWKIGQRLSLDLGLRYELNPAPSEADGKYPTIVTGITDPSDISGAQLAPPGSPFYKTFYTAFAPRFGIAYLLNNKPGRETIIRGGFGVYYDMGASGSLIGFQLIATKSCSQPIPFPLAPACSERPVLAYPTTLPVTVAAGSNSEDLTLPYSLQWNAAVEQSIGKRQALTVSYVASAGRSLLTGQTLNPLVNGRRQNPNFSTITYVFNGPKSEYHSMQAQYRMRFYHGATALVNYTWSHAIDDVSNDVFVSVFDRGDADFDVRHNFSGALHYEIPQLNAGEIVKVISRNWSLDAIVHAQTGQPLNITSGVTVVLDGVSYSLRPDLVPGQPLYISDPSVAGGRRFNNQAFTAPTAGRQGSLGRNVLRELPIYQFDVALGRTFKIAEQVELQLKGEVFNVFNHPMFGTYGLNSSNLLIFGVPSRTLNQSLGGQNLLYQMGGPRSIQLSAKVSF